MGLNPREKKFFFLPFFQPPVRERQRNPLANFFPWDFGPGGRLKRAPLLERGAQLPNLEGAKRGFKFIQGPSGSKFGAPGIWAPLVSGGIIGPGVNFIFRAHSHFWVPIWPGPGVISGTPIWVKPGGFGPPSRLFSRTARGFLNWTGSGGV